MRRLPLALLVLVALAPPAAAGSQTLALKASPDLPADFAVTIATDMVAELHLSMNGVDYPISAARHEAYRLEALEVDGDHLRKARIQFQAITDTTPQATTDPRSGKTYVVEPGSTAFLVNRDDGTAVTGDELVKVVDEFRPLFQRLPLRSFLIGRKFKRGKKVTLDAKEFAEVFGGSKSELDVTAFTLTLRSHKKGRARFALACTLSKDTGNGVLTFEATGELVVDTKRVLPTSIHLTGEASGAIQGLTTTGTLDLTRTYTY